MHWSYIFFHEAIDFGVLASKKQSSAAITRFLGSKKSIAL